MENKLTVKTVPFMGANLMAAKDEQTGKVYVGVSYVCRGIGFDKGQKDRQVENVQQDIVLKEGCRKFAAGVFDPNNETANRVGRTAKAHGLQTEEYGIWALDKSRYSAKQVKSFRYNAIGRAKLLEILGA